MKKLIIVSAILMSLTAYAEEAFVSFGPGVSKSASAGNLGYRADVYRGMYLQSKVGFYGQGTVDPDKQSSGYLAVGPGVTIDLKPVEFRGGYSVVVISNTDHYLSNNFPMFQGEAYTGFRDHLGNGIGVQYEYMTSARFSMPNRGRESFTVQVSTQW